MTTAVSPATRAGSSGDGVAELWVLAERNLATLGSRRNIINSIINAMLYFFGYAVVLHGILHAAGIDFGQFFPPAIIVQMMGSVAMASGFELATDRSNGMLRRCRSLPIRSSAVVFARLAADTALALWYLILVLAVGFGFGFRFQRSLGYTLLFLLVAAGFGVAMSVAVAPLSLSSRRPQAVGTLLFLVIFPLTFCSAVFVPIAAFPGWLQSIVRVSPFTVDVQALRALSTQGQSLTPMWYALGWIAALIAVGGWLSVRAWRRAA